METPRPTPRAGTPFGGADIRTVYRAYDRLSRGYARETYPVAPNPEAGLIAAMRIGDYLRTRHPSFRPMADRIA